MIEVLKQSEIGLANLISYQSTPNKPTIHEYGQAVRALSMVRKAIQEEALRNVQRIGQEIEQEPVAVKRMKEWIQFLKRQSDNGQYMNITCVFSAGSCWELAIELEQFINTYPPQRTEQDLSEQGRNRSAILGNNIEEMVNNGLPFLTALDTALKVYDHHTPQLHQPQRTEPPAWFPAVENILNEYGLQAIDFVADFKAAMKDAEQPQRTWVGLTDEEVDDLAEFHGLDFMSYDPFTRAIEAKLKEKNNG